MIHTDDDLTFFAMEVVKYFGIEPTLEEWHWTGAIEEVANLAPAHQARKT